MVFMLTVPDDVILMTALTCELMTVLAVTANAAAEKPKIDTTPKTKEINLKYLRDLRFTRLPSF
jgi:hypothetical protein